MSSKLKPIGLWLGDFTRSANAKMLTILEFRVERKEKMQRFDARSDVVEITPFLRCFTGSSFHTLSRRSCSRRSSSLRESVQEEEGL